MRIENLGSERNGRKAKISAHVIWEDCDRPPFELTFETESDFSEDFQCNPHTFAVACLMPAMYFGEERIRLEAGICPELKDGLGTAMSWIRHWYYTPTRKLPRIETQAHCQPPQPPPNRAAVLFSGGVDSLCTVRNNRLNYPADHPKAIKDGILVYGVEIKKKPTLAHVAEAISRLAADADLNLIPVATNMRGLGPDDEMEFWRFWANEFEAAAFSSIAHAFAKRINTLYIGSSYDVSILVPHASHPLIDPNFGSSNLQIRHDGLALSRIGKIRVISEWEAALRNLRVCNHQESYEDGRLNCGRCEKCIRTMLGFLVLGLLDKTEAFPIDDVSSELILEGVRMTHFNYPHYWELIHSLEQIGRRDLVAALREKLAHYHASQRQQKRKAAVKQFDTKYLNSSLLKLKRTVCGPFLKQA